jgi:hypothetical protein
MRQSQCCPRFSPIRIPLVHDIAPPRVAYQALAHGPIPVAFKVFLVRFLWRSPSKIDRMILKDLGQLHSKFSLFPIEIASVRV